MSQFDTLLDFGDTPASETNGSTTQQDFDEFDPFSPSAGTVKVEGKTSADSDGLLVDFGLDSQSKSSEQQNGLNPDPFNGHQFDDIPSNSNPLYEMSSDNTNPLYEFDNTESEFANEILSAVESNQKVSQSNSSNPLYDLSNTDDIDDEQLFSAPASKPDDNSNPLYDMNNSANHEYNDNSIQDGSYDQDIIQSETSYDYSNNGGPLDDSTQESDQLQDIRNSGGNWETSETFTSSSTGPEGETITETVITRTSKSRSRSPEVVENVTEVRKSRSRSPEIVESVTEVRKSRSHSPEVIETVTEVRKSRSRSPEVIETVTEVRKSRSRSPEVIETVTEVRKSRSYSPEVIESVSNVRSSSPVVEDDGFTRQEVQQEYSEPEPEPEPARQYEERTTETKKDTQDGRRTVTTTTTRTETVTEVKGGSRGGSSSSMKIKEDSTISTPKQNGVETSRSREEVRKSEQSRNMANVATAPPPVNNQQMMNDYDDEDDEDGDAVYENVPSPARTDVFRETDVKTDLELPQLGRASSMKERFLKLAGESASGQRTADKELTPPPEIKGVIEAGVFESQPSQQRQDVYRFRDTRHEDPVPEKGKALNTVQKYKEIASREFKAADKREITPDKTGNHEYVSEPRAEHLTYEERPLEAGIFESKPLVAENVSRYEDYVHEELPEIGSAKSIASKFKEIEKNAHTYKAANKREVTPDRHGHGEYVTEPRAQHLTYEEKVEGGVYENQPAAVSEDIYRHEEYYTPDTVPEKGTAKNLVSRFREIEKNAAVPKPSGRQITPPREDAKNVFENVPTDSPIAYKETVRYEDVLPEKGKAKNLASKYKVIEQENLKAKGGDRRVKEFTPPKDERTVFESTPRDSGLRYEEAPVESGILENQPTVREDIYRESDPRDIEVELPERGAAKNLLSRWKQIESESANKTPPTPGRYKEFTPPRTDDRVKEQRPPMSPGIQNNSVQPNDLPGQYQQASSEPSVFESTPTAPREDLYREADTDFSSGLPKANKTKKMLSRFQAIQQKAQEPVTSSTKREEPEYTIPHIKDNKPQNFRN